MAPTTTTVTVQPKHQTFRNELLTAHKALRRSLDRIIELAPYLPQEHNKHFLLYCNTFLAFLHEHHTIEDTICFPLLSGPCGVKAEIEKLDEEHETMINLMEELKQSLQLPYDGKKIAAAATALKDMMYDHLAFEESVFVVEVIARADTSVLDEIRKRIDGVLKKADPFTVLPFLISHLTSEEADFMVFNSAPWLLKHLLFPLLFSRKHKKAWALAAAPQAVAAH